MKFLLFSKLFILLLCSFSFSQEKGLVESKPIALINPLAFEDEKTGIVELTKAYNLLYLSDCFPSPCSQESHIKRKKILIDPVLAKISEFLKQIEIQNNITILDGVKLEENGQLLGFDEKLNITEKLIPQINEYFKIGSKPTLKVNLPTAKIAVINTDTFYDENFGVKIYLKKIKEVEKQIKKETGSNPTNVEVINRIRSDNPQNNIVDKLSKAMHFYTKEKGFGIALDSSKKIPDELENIHLQDITNEFISYYNQLNP